MPAWKCCNPRYIKNELKFCGGLTVQLVYAAQQFHNVQQPVVVCSFSGDSDSNALKSLQYLSKSPILPVFIALSSSSCFITLHSYWHPVYLMTLMHLLTVSSYLEGCFPLLNAYLRQVLCFIVTNGKTSARLVLSQVLPGCCSAAQCSHLPFLQPTDN